MVRLLGMVMQDNNRVEYALTRLYGIGWATAGKICKAAGIDTHKKLGQLNEEEIKKMTAVIENTYKVEGDLREELSENIKRLREIVSYRGLRHVKGLPVRGQRTKSNARTKKGKRKTVGALKKEVWAKMEQNKTAAPAAAPAKGASSK